MSTAGWIGFETGVLGGDRGADEGDRVKDNGEANGVGVKSRLRAADILGVVRICVAPRTAVRISSIALQTYIVRYMFSWVTCVNFRAVRG